MPTRVTCCSKETKPTVNLLLISSLLEKNRSGPLSEDLHRQSFYKTRKTKRKKNHPTKI